ncbi:MAG: SH3 domain-containing protein [Candidatus Aminicenantes bacterium]|nr:SH3 domain-containing protein [Candidatus Aminicenantes bacterium]
MTHKRGAALLAAALALFLVVRIGAAVRIRVTAEVANLRLRPDIGSAIIRLIPRGTLLLSTAKEGDWYLVSVTTESGRTETGYVHESLVTLLSPEGEPEPGREPQPAEPAGPPPKPPEQKPAPRETASSFFSRGNLFSLILGGGGVLVRGGDLNLGAQGLAVFFEDSLAAVTEDPVNPLRFGYAAGAEWLLPLAERVSLGLGAEFLRSRRQSAVLYRKGADEYAYTVTLSVWDLPLKAYLDFAPVSFVHLKIGVEYHIARAGYEYLWETKDGWQEWTGNAGGRGLGVFGGLALEWPLASSFSLVLDFGGRYAPLTGFSGTGTYLDSEGISSEENGTLYYYETRIAGRPPYALLFIRSRVPSEGGVYNPRAAEVDFTGLVLKAGFKMTF